jgi:uncharacterized membrane protein
MPPSRRRTGNVRTDQRTTVGVEKESEADKVAVVFNYLVAVFPPIYDTNRSMWSTMFDELIRHHAYITFFNFSDAATAKEKALSGIRLLTVQSMMMFLMAVFIDLEVCSSHSIDRHVVPCALRD